MILPKRNTSIDWRNKTEKGTRFPSILSKKRISSHSSGFTLIELLIVMVILAILAAIGFLAYRGYLHKAYNAVAIGDIVKLEKELYLFGVDHVEPFPPDLGTVGYAGFLDPWGNPYVYQRDLTIAPRTKAGTPINTTYDLYSMGKDGQTALELNDPLSHDDIISADDGSYKGRGDQY